MSTPTILPPATFCANTAGGLPSTTTNTIITGNLSVTGAVSAHGGFGNIGRLLTMNDLSQHPVFKASITELVDLWRMKYGNDWVREQDLENEDFYALSAKRLVAVGKLEKHHVIDPHGGVLRLVE